MVLLFAGNSMILQKNRQKVLPKAKDNYQMSFYSTFEEQLNHKHSHQW